MVRIFTTGLIPGATAETGTKQKPERQVTVDTEFSRLDSTSFGYMFFFGNTLLGQSAYRKFKSQQHASGHSTV